MISDGQEKPSSSDVKAVDASKVEVEAKATFHPQPSAAETEAAAEAEVSGDASLSFSVLNDYNDSCLSLNLTDELADGVNHSILAAQNFDDNHFSDYWATEQKELEKLKHQLDVYNAEKNRVCFLIKQAFNLIIAAFNTQTISEKSSGRSQYVHFLHIS